jgi:hypothetical protein
MGVPWSWDRKRKIEGGHQGLSGPGNFADAAFRERGGNGNRLDHATPTPRVSEIISNMLQVVAKMERKVNDYHGDAA